MQSTCVAQDTFVMEKVPTRPSSWVHQFDSAPSLIGVPLFLCLQALLLLWHWRLRWKLYQVKERRQRDLEDQWRAMESQKDQEFQQKTLAMEAKLAEMSQKKDEIQKDVEEERQRKEQAERELEEHKEKTSAVEALLFKLSEENQQVQKDSNQCAKEPEPRRDLELKKSLPQREMDAVTDAAMEKERPEFEELQEQLARHEAKLLAMSQENEQLRKDLQDQQRVKAEAEKQLKEHEQKLAKYLQMLQQKDRQNLGSLLQLPMANGDQVTRHQIDPWRPEHHELKAMFKDSLTNHRLKKDSTLWCEKPELAVIRIEEVINPFKQPAYLVARNEVMRRSQQGCTPISFIKAARSDNLELNEYFLFHGTRFDLLEHILRNGLDPQRGGGSAGRLFGHGTYFAENASKSDFYTTCEECARAGQASFLKCKHPEATRCMLVAQVLLGESLIVKKPDQNRLRAADRPDGLPYDSHTALKIAFGGCVDHMEYIIFKEQLALVRFLIFYRHTSTCQCKDCAFRRSDEGS